MRRATSLLFAALALAPVPALADDVQLAVAANFAGPVRLLVENFSRTASHKVSISTGSTGKFYAQIRNGAPFDVFLSADDETPARLEQEKLGVPGSRFTYAVGKLVLWSPVAGVVDGNGDVLRKGSFKRLAIANPKLAPYGAAAQQTMEKLGVWSSIQPKLVMGENIAQTFQFVSTGNADLAFVALSQLQDGSKSAGSVWLVPATYHDSIKQDAVLLERARGNAGARQFLEFLRSAPARDMIRAAGYELP